MDAAGPESGHDDLVVQASRVVLGLAGLGASVVRRLLDPADSGEPARDGPADLLHLVSWSAVGLGLAAQRHSLRVVRGAGARLSPLAGFVAQPLVARWGERGRAEQLRNRAAAEEFVRALVRDATIAVLDEVDLNGVAERIDLDRAAGRLDMNRAAERIDVDRIAARVDVDRVAARIDVNTIVARADIDAVIDRLDLADLVQRVLDEIDFSRIVRESSGTMTVEAVDAFRDRGVSADRFLSRVADRLLNRSAVRDTTGPAPLAEES
ncbi:hypothetical protein G5C51_01740 [Streptomyces sp. A7024]|uniref:Uncharacterized protein n=1 Tax=Streptomyces coryli TaxID=1128680 RepID=A0A6G4TUC3_9ACTN|nr:hypothetical protein [Streptomyces coryli]NGN62627.1 hypothetical protein [Streptomyces coryli]